MYGYGYGNDYSVWNFIFMLFMMVLGVAGIVIVVRYFSKNSTGGHREETALELLQKRYAKGDIDKKEFAEMRKDLKG